MLNRFELPEKIVRFCCCFNCTAKLPVSVLFFAHTFSSTKADEFYELQKILRTI
jgi:hypothetical protein